MTIEREPDHPIIEAPWKYRVMEFHYHVDEASWQDSYIDIVLKRDEVIRRLRFHAPQKLKIEEGFPSSTSGMAILDIRSRQLDGLGVEVYDFECSYGSVTFFARDVLDLDAPG